MKYLIIPFFALAAVLTANAHCGACEKGHEAKKSEMTEKAHAHKDAAKDKEMKAACCMKEDGKSNMEAPKMEKPAMKEGAESKMEKTEEKESMM